jgi:hypothetical protein
MEWPFDQPRNCAVITLRQIAHGLQPIVHVTHDSDDHGWQFLGWENARREDASIVCLSHIVELDPSVLQLADLPPGWHAWRQSPEEAWSREPNPYEQEED